MPDEHHASGPQPAASSTTENDVVDPPIDQIDQPPGSIWLWLAMSLILGGVCAMLLVRWISGTWIETRRGRRPAVVAPAQPRRNPPTTEPNSVP